MLCLWDGLRQPQGGSTIGWMKYPSRLPNLDSESTSKRQLLNVSQVTIKNNFYFPNIIGHKIKDNLFPNQLYLIIKRLRTLQRQKTKEIQVGFGEMEFKWNGEGEDDKVQKMGTTSLGWDHFVSPVKQVCAGEQVHPKQKFAFRYSVLSLNISRRYLKHLFTRASWKNGWSWGWAKKIHNQPGAFYCARKKKEW